MRQTQTEESIDCGTENYGRGSTGVQGNRVRAVTLWKFLEFHQN